MKRTTIFTVALAAMLVSAFTAQTSLAAGAVAGSVTDIEGAGVEGALVTLVGTELNGENGRFYAQTRTSAEGNFSFERVPEGPCLVTAAARYLGTARARIMVETNAEVRVSLRLPYHRPQGEPGHGSLSGVVVDAEGNAVANATIILLPNRLVCGPHARPIRLSAQTNFEGSFSIQSMPEGLWIAFVSSGRVRLQRAGFVEISGNTETSVQFVLGRR